VGGVGINLAIQDAVATANLLAAKLKANVLQDEDLDSVRQRRLFPVKVIQRFQLSIHNRLLKPAISGVDRQLTAPWLFKFLDRNPGLRRWPAQILGLGVRPEHVRSPEAP
jgi:2-polyprenyl-6-methoxyphenol hydroxylase-like FAD-dependent oxidoreductase